MGGVLKKQVYYERAGTLDPGLVARYYRHAGTVRTVLDVGCGLGCFGRLKPDPSIVVHGVDVDAGAVARAGQWERTVVVDLERGSLPHDSGSFDAVFAKDILEHLDTPSVLVGEIRRVLRPGGVLVASFPMEYPWVVWDDYTHVRGFTRAAAAMLFEDVGFEVRAVLPMGGIPGFGRLGLVDAIPSVLSVPLFRRWFGRSWELVARAPGTPA
jgi:SAM-dependent methyltransferase